MNLLHDLAVYFLAPAVIAAVVSAFVSLVTSERRIDAENVLQERKKWRDTIRTLAEEVHVALADPDRQALKLNALRAKFSLHLNPHDPMDQGILAVINVEQFDRQIEFDQRVALLLKHDWERAKREASLWKRVSERSPRRMAFEDFVPGRPHRYRIGRLHEFRVFWLGEMRSASERRESPSR
jgi:hypothetical protein